MDKVTVVGSYEFLGFHFCQYFLNKGLEVEGIQLDLKEDDLFIEEKQMEFGRNANFIEVDDHSWHSTENTENLLIVDYYDFFIRGVEQQFLKNKYLQAQIRTWQGKVILLLPILLVGNKNHDVIIDLFENKSVQFFYLPTVYGPWQPNYFVFEQSMVRKREQIVLGEREYTSDCIFVDDVIQAIVQFVEEDHQEILLKSKRDNNWKDAIEFLGLADLALLAGDKKIEFHGIQKVLQDEIHFRKGLERQREKALFLLALRNCED